MSATDRLTETTSNAPSVVVACLRVAVALQAIGVGLQRLGLGGMWEDESPVFSLLLYDWQWNEEVAQRIDDVGAWLYFACGLALFLLPSMGAVMRRLLGRTKVWMPVWTWQIPLCLIVAAWQIVMTVVAWHRGGFFMSEWELAGESARIALPLALLLLSPGLATADVSTRRVTVCMWILRVAACLTFLAHGLKSYFLNPAFVDYLLSAAGRISWEVSQSAAESVLRIIGCWDIMLATLILLRRWRWVAFYMAGWALIAALARVVQAGFDAHYEVLVRAGNYCVPLILGLSWQISRPRRPTLLTSESETADV